MRSVDVIRMTEPCFALGRDGGCRILVLKQDGCGTAKCPFYKPYGCKDWIRKETKDGLEFIPPEDYGKKRR